MAYMFRSRVSAKALPAEEVAVVEHGFGRRVDDGGGGDGGESLVNVSVCGYLLNLHLLKDSASAALTVGSYGTAYLYMI